MFTTFKVPKLRRNKSVESPGGRTLKGKPPKAPLAAASPKSRKCNSESETLAASSLGASTLCPSIASLRPGSVALSSDQLTPGDRIHSINGINTSRMKPEEVSTLLDNVDGNALLEIEYCLPSYDSQNSLCVASKVTEVIVERVDESLGITLRGGFVSEHPHLSRPLVITQVRPHGPAYNTGRIRVGDRLLKVDHYNLTQKTLLEAQQILKDSSVLAVSTLTIEYDVSIMESVKYATGPLLVEVDRHANEDLGLMLSNCSCDFVGREEITSAGIFVDHIIPASTADRCGALCAGDQLLAIDEVNLEEWNSGIAEAEHLLKIASKIQIMPLCALQRIAARAYGLGSYASSPSASGFSTLNSKRSRTARYTPRSHRYSAISKSEDSVSNYLGYSSNIGVCHSEALSVTLIAERGKGFGLAVGVNEHEDPRPADIIITRIVPESPAFRCGCLQNGDRIIAVNHQPNLTLQEINALFELGAEPNCPSGISGKVTLQIDFDVADTIVPSSGIFTVKLARRGVGLGITITASKAHPEDPFIISEIRRGSVAHRTGTLHAGDRLLAIDNRPLDHLTVENAFDILHSSTNDIVTIKVEKTESDQLLIDTVVYTVELIRHGGPLGITIAGSEDCSEPIILSRLTEGGLAEKTAALHVGDRLTAINGEPLEHKPLSEAIRLLQSSGDRVQLKISRNLNSSSEERRCNYSSPGLPSIDSAVHSWDSNPAECSESGTFEVQSAAIKDFESVLSETLSYQEARDLSERKHDSQLQFYSDAEDVFCPSPLPLPNFLGLKYDNIGTQYGIAGRFQDSESMADNDIHHVTLYKDAVYDDYGFSVSDGLYEKGVYINRIRKGGPADIAGTLKPYDRIIQVNDTKTQDFDCCLTVPLIASAGDRIDLIVARNLSLALTHEVDEVGLTRKSLSTISTIITKTL